MKNGLTELASSLKYSSLLKKKCINILKKKAISQGWSLSINLWNFPTLSYYHELNINFNLFIIFTSLTDPPKLNHVKALTKIVFISMYVDRYILRYIHILFLAILTGKNGKWYTKLSFISRHFQGLQIKAKAWHLIFHFFLWELHEIYIQVKLWITLRYYIT